MGLGGLGPSPSLAMPP